MTEPIRNAPGFRAGEYELLRRIGQGGMGEVFIARRRAAEGFEKRVALKLLLPHLYHEPEFVERFLDEARLAARMNHPNIVEVFDLGEADGRYFIAMALVEGVSLRRLLLASEREGAKIPLPIVRLIASGLCEALEYAHALRGPDGSPLRLVHRDVTPHNVLLSVNGAVLLTDFGVAKAAGANFATRPGFVIGKMAYLPPEALRPTEPVDRRVDVYGAALTLDEALSGRAAFARGSMDETIQAVRTERLPDPRATRSDVSDRMAQAILRGAARDKDERFGSARELLEGLLDGEVARPSELAALVQSWCGSDLDAIREQPAAAIGQTQTRSLLDADATTDVLAPPPSPKRGRWLVGAGGALSVALAGLALAAALSGRRASPPEPAPMLPAAHPASATAPVPPREPVAPPPAAQPPPATTEVAAGAPPSPERRAAPARPKRPRVGYLSADAVPWASVFIDGKEVDKTPLSRYPLPAGQHVVVFKNPNFGRQVRRVVEIEPDRTRTLQAVFEE